MPPYLTLSEHMKDMVGVKLRRYYDLLIQAHQNNEITMVAVSETFQAPGSKKYYREHLILNDHRFQQVSVDLMERPEVRGDYFSKDEVLGYSPEEFQRLAELQRHQNKKTKGAA